MAIETFSVKLKSVEQISPFVKHFVFHCDKSDFAFVPGQFVTIHFEHEGKVLRRSYSIACSPNSESRIEFAAGYVKNGPASELLFHLKPGDSLDMSGPFGRLVLKEETPKRYIFLSTSTGVTPFRSMLSELSERLKTHPELNIVLLEGVQYRRDALYLNDFQAFAEKHLRFQYYACYSRETETLAGHERIGHVQAQFDELNLQPEHDVVYLCGNPNMIDEAFATLKEKAFDVRSILREKYISSK